MTGRGKKKPLFNSAEIDNLFINLKPKGRYQLTQYAAVGTSFLACAGSFLKLLYIDLILIYKCSHNRINLDNDTGLINFKNNNNMSTPFLCYNTRGHARNYQMHHHQGIHGKLITKKFNGFGHGTFQLVANPKKLNLDFPPREQLLVISYGPVMECTGLNNQQLTDYGYDYKANLTGVIKYDSCEIGIYNHNTSRNETLPCVNGYTYDGMKRHLSIVTEWDLVCENGALAELSQTLYAVGCLLGAMVIPVFSDKFGRKPAHLGSLFMLLLNEMLLVAAQNYWVFAILRMTEGAFNYGMIMPAYSLMLELFPGSSRTIFAASTGIIWGVAMLLMTPLAYACSGKSWRIVCIAFGSLAATLFFEFWLIEDSIRWLLTNNRIDEARKIVKRAARENGVDFDEIWEKCVEPSTSLVPLKDEKHSADAEPEVEVEDLGIMTIVRDPLARTMSIILVFNALMNSLTYYGIYMTAVQLAGNPYLNFVLTSLMEILGNVFMLFMLTKFERRTTMFFFQTFSGSSLIISVIIIFAVEASPATAVANKICTLFGMFGISASFCVLWLYAPEVYPTNLRNSGMGLMGIGSALGNIIAPFSRYVGRHLGWLPATIFGIGTVLGSFMLLTLPESKDAQMPTTMDDVRALRKKRKGFLCSL